MCRISPSHGRLVAISALLCPVVLFGQFAPACSEPHYPSPAPSSSLDIDSACGLDGSGSVEGPQNAAKNNFCATGDTTPITIAQMTARQKTVNADHSIPFGTKNTATRKKGPATNREPLQQLGEGTIRTLTGYVLIARQEGAESVNCGKSVPNAPLDHDIHISIVAAKPKKSSSECSGVVVEMSPHHRPDSWTAANVKKVSAAKLLVRVTGQLFFDSSHVPCSGGKAVTGNPARVSLWELHPIYAFEVCTADCTSKTPTWTALDQWIAQQSE